MILDAPPAAVSGTVIAVFQRDGAIGDIVVLDPSTGASSHALRDLGGDERVRVTTFSYAEAPAVFGLTPGTLRTTQDGCYGLATLPSSTAPEIFSNEVADGAASGWKPVTLASLDPAIAALRLLDACDPCSDFASRFSQQLITLDATCGASFAQRAPDGTVLVGSEWGYTGEEGCFGPGKIFRVPIDPPSRISNHVRISPHSPVQDLQLALSSTPTAGGYFDASGTMWLGGQKGEVWHAVYQSTGPPDFPHELRLYELTRTNAPLVALTSSPAVTLSRFRWFGGTTRSGLPLELYARSSEGAFERYDGTRWSPVHRSVEQDLYNHGGVAWLAQGEAIGVSIRDMEIARWSEGSLHLERFTDDRTERPTAVAVIPGAGTLIGTNLGALYRHEPATRKWSRYGTIATGTPVATIFPHGSGFIASGTNGFVLWSERPDDPSALRTCAGVFAHGVRFSARLGDDAYVLAGPTRSNQPVLVVTVLKARPR